MKQHHLLWVSTELNFQRRKMRDVFYHNVYATLPKVD